MLSVVHTRADDDDSVSKFHSEQCPRSGLFSYIVSLTLFLDLRNSLIFRAFF